MGDRPSSGPCGCATHQRHAGFEWRTCADVAAGGTTRARMRSGVQPGMQAAPRAAPPGLMRRCRVCRCFKNRPDVPAAGWARSRQRGQWQGCSIVWTDRPHIRGEWVRHVSRPWTPRRKPSILSSPGLRGGRQPSAVLARAAPAVFPACPGQCRGLQPKRQVQPPGCPRQGFGLDAAAGIRRRPGMPVVRARPRNPGRPWAGRCRPGRLVPSPRWWPRRQNSNAATPSESRAAVGH